MNDERRSGEDRRSNWDEVELRRRRQLRDLIGRVLEVAKEHERLYGDLKDLTREQVSEALGIL